MKDICRQRLHQAEKWKCPTSAKTGQKPAGQAYGAGLHLVDFMNATEASRQTINSWVEGQTNNRIQGLIPQGGVSTDTRLVLTNAIWFKANWASQFSKNGTTDQSFINRDRQTGLILFIGKVVSL